MENKVVLPTEERLNHINSHAQKVLTELLKEYEIKYGEDTYEAEFVGDLFARLVMAHYMGYYTDKLADEASQSAQHIMHASGVVMEETTKLEDTP